MPLSPDPQTADKIIKFDGTPGRASVLSYDVTMPGRYRGRRVLHLDLGLAPGDIQPAATSLTAKILALEWTLEGDVWRYAPGPARDLWFAKAREAYGNATSNGFSWATALTAMQDLAAQKPLTGEGRLQGLNYVELKERIPNAGDEILEGLPGMYTYFVEGLPTGVLWLPVQQWNGWVTQESSRAEDVMSTSTEDGHFFLVELYGISSFLGDYGLGRTVRTFTLLPGEETKITMKTWRTDTSKAAQATSIVDSYDERSASRFNDTVQSETTDKQTRNNKLSWHVEAEVSASWGWGSAKVSGGAAGENQSAREQFSKDVTNSVKEHSAEAASNRSNSVTLSTETETVSGQEMATERTIRNINLRRVLNFVFRELNQEYRTYVHLLEVRVGFATSTPDSYREVPVAGLRPLLEDVLVDGKADEVARQMLGMIGTVMSENGTPVTTLEKLTLNPDGSFSAAAAAPDPTTGAWSVPPADRSFLYRWIPGPLAQDPDAAQRVDGVVMNTTSIVMPTADLVVEALLGEADALDPFAMRAQYEEAEDTALANRKLKLALETLEAIGDPAERADAWAKIFPAPATTP